MRKKNKALKSRLQVSKNHYFENNYDDLKRFASYWHQINQIIKLNPKNILEIGPGNGFISDYLKKRDFNIKTLDIDKDLKPDKLGSVLNIPFDKNSFSLVACFELLEHIPYKKIPKALKEIQRVTKKYVVISIPDINTVLGVYLNIPKIGIIKKLIPLPFIKKGKHKFDGEHYWETGAKNYKLKDFKNKLKKANLTIIKTYRIFEHPFHRIFVLKKK